MTSLAPCGCSWEAAQTCGHWEPVASDEVRRRVAAVVEQCLENPAIPRNAVNFGRQVAAMLAAEGLLATGVPSE